MSSQKEKLRLTPEEIWEDHDWAFHKKSRAVGFNNPGAQVLLLVTTNLPKLAWKYEGIAYSLTLKNLGCLFQTWYLVATALNLAPCAIGCGDSVNFARATGIPERQEALIGEFALGSRP